MTTDTTHQGAGYRAAAYPADHMLQDATRLALAALLARLDPDQHARPWFWVDFRKGPQEAHSYWDYCDIAGRYVDGLALGRIVTADLPPDRDALEAEERLREFLWAQQDPADGLFYNPEDDVTGSEMSKYLLNPSASERPRHVDMFCQRAPLLAMTTLLAAGDTSLRARIYHMIRGLANIAEYHGDEARFASYRWAPTVRPEWMQGTGAPEKWQGYRYALLTALARYVELTGDPAATDLALRLARWYIRHGDVPPDGRFRGNTHSGGILPTAVGIARLAACQGDADMLAWANRVYLWVAEQTPDFGFLADGLGLDGFFSGTSETCALTDYIHLALLLTEAGAGEYWDDIERISRNQLIENQYRDPVMLRAAFPGITERVLNMLYGGFECAAYPNSLLTWDGAEGCCIGGGLRALYLTWRAGVTEDEHAVRVNLGFSQETGAAAITGFEPWEGRVEVRLHAPRAVLIRAPGYAAAGEMAAWVDGRPVQAGWDGRYVRFPGLAAGQTAAITYPLGEATRDYRIAGHDYRGTWRGNTLVGIDPPGSRYPTYQRRSLIDAGAPVKVVERQGAQVAAARLRALW
jgi:hypothetical protein